MKNKKIAIIFIIIVIIVAILAGMYKIMTSYMFKVDDNIEIENGEDKLVEYLKGIEDIERKESQVEWYLETNKITEEQAKEILGK